MFMNYLLKNICAVTNSGITSELDFILDKFRKEKEITSYKIVIKEVDNYVRHNVTIELESYSEEKAMVLFHKLLCFLDTNNLNYYNKQCFDKSMIYTYITAFKDNGDGYYYYVVFE